ncbi:RNA polymerase sigma factor [Chakrabartyella piscis]|uniref:RNA polymerase sigma factor n=1 Tax=Chakrabartyella piscis TaxID=2918914 RepID=UPI002958C398|nr:sigma factor-like helix-turn-helix DNA-binding protein [Chakrabartyella piscis]
MPKNEKYENNDTMRFPKRRKSNDNPYELSYSKKQNSYIITFVDGNGNKVALPIDESLYETFNQFELDDLSELNEYDRHRERISLDENEIYNRQGNLVCDTCDIVDKQIRSEKLWQAIKQLPQTQKRRVILYYFDDLTYEEIAVKEHCSPQAIAYSIATAKKSLKNFLK